jgi:PAS domain S-box-containing protein
LSFARTLYGAVLIFFFITGAWSARAESGKPPAPPKTIRAWIQAASPPTYFRDPKTNQAAGFAVDVLNEIARREGFSVTYEFENNWGGIADAFREGKADVAPGQGITEDRKEIVAFTLPIATFPVSIFVRENSTITELRDDLTVGVTRNSSSSEMIRKAHPNIRLVVYEHNSVGLMDLLSGRIDAFCTSAVTLTQLAINAGLEDKIRIAGNPVTEVKRAIAVRKDAPELLAMLNRGIENFSHTPEYQKIYTKWHGKPAPYWTAETIFFVMSGIVLVIIALMALWRYRSIVKLNRDLQQHMAERTKAEEAAYHAQQDWEESFHSINDAITIHDREFNVVRANRAAQELLDLDFLAVTRQKCHESFHKTGCPHGDCPGCRTLASGKPSTSEMFEPKLGKFIEVKAFPRFDRDGNLSGLVHVVRDITESRRTGEALVEQQMFFTNLLQNSATATFVLDKTHRIMIWNKACEKLTGCLEAEMLGTDNQWKPFYGYQRPTVADLVLEDSVERLPELYQTYFRSVLNPQGFGAEGWYDNVGGKDRYLVFEASPIHNSKGELIAAIETLHDHTERKRLEEQLLQAQKLEAIGQLAGGVAHDFNNILSAIMGYTEMMQMKMKPADPLNTNLEQIIRASERATSLTQSLLAFSRKQVINPKPVDLNEIVRRFEKFLTRLIREDIEIGISCAADELTVLADGGQIEQMLMNLVTNARDAMPGGGRIAIGTELTSFDKAFIERHGYGKEGAFALITVSDTGVGMAPKVKERIFEPFFTTKEPGKGTGLGLSMVYGLVKQHGGYIDVYSEQGKGTTFKIYLPLFSGFAKDDLQEAAPVAVRGGSETILLAEDDEALRDLTAAMLRNYGYRVIEAVDGEDALAKYRENRGAVQLLVTDGIMPKKNGNEVYREIRTMDPSIKAIFVSGYAEDIFSKAGLLEAGINFILKPFTPLTLLAKVREILDAK